MTTLYASFIDASSAEKAGGALLDHGADPVDLSIVAAEASESSLAANNNTKAANSEDSAKGGLSTTTSADAAAGAAKGAGLGLGVATLAVLASIFVPGIGLVVGGGALAVALAAGAATVVAGSVAGSVYGYLRDQGVPDEQATQYNDHFLQGGAILEISVPTGSLSSAEVEGILSKYGAGNVAAYNSTRTILDEPKHATPDMPFETDANNVDAGPLGIGIEEAASARVKRVIEASTGESRIVANVPGDISIDPRSGEVSVSPNVLVVKDEGLVEAQK